MKEKKIIILVLILIIGVFFVSKIIGSGNEQVKFKVVKEEDLPEKIAEMLPKYLMEERALTAKYRDEIYVVVTRGEKQSKGYLVEIDQILKEEYSKEEFDIVIYAKFTDPDPNEIVEQEYDYPFIVVKTNLKTMPLEVHLDVEYNE